jgi:hypothetical protein
MNNDEVVRDLATIAGKEDKNKKIKSKSNEPSTAEPASRMARYPVLLVLPCYSQIMTTLAIDELRFMR